MTAVKNEDFCGIDLLLFLDERFMNAQCVINLRMVGALDIKRNFVLLQNNVKDGSIVCMIQ